MKLLKKLWSTSAVGCLLAAATLAPSDALPQTVRTFSTFNTPNSCTVPSSGPFTVECRWALLGGTGFANVQGAYFDFSVPSSMPIYAWLYKVSFTGSWYVDRAAWTASQGASDTYVPAKQIITNPSNYDYFGATLQLASPCVLSPGVGCLNPTVYGMAVLTN